MAVAHTMLTETRRTESDMAEKNEPEHGMSTKNKAESDETPSVQAEDIAKEIAALRKMTVKELRRRHVELFGEGSRSSNRQYLFRRIAWRIQSLAEGDLSERARRRARELARDADLRSRPPKELTMEPAPADLKTVTGKVAMPRDERLPMPGTVLKRVFKGHEYHVTVLPHGFEYDGQAYRSLTAVAHAITGSHWNGWHFFGLATPTRAGGEDSAT